jgi:hypothetical protein
MGFGSRLADRSYHVQAAGLGTSNIKLPCCRQMFVLGVRHWCWRVACCGRLCDVGLVA